MKRRLLLIVASTFLLQGCVSIPGGIHGETAKTNNHLGTNLTLSTEFSDDGIKSKAFTIVNKMPQLQQGKSNVEITAYNRIVLLVGQVPTAALKNTIGKKISQIKGVNRVVNNLRVGIKDSWGDYSHDSWITTKVKADFIGQVNPNHFKVVTENGVVYLLGVTTKAEGAQAIATSKKVSGVRKVVPIFTYIPEDKPTKK